MAEKFILQGSLMWSYAYEMADFTKTQKVLVSMMNFIPPLHRHNGLIALTNDELIIEGIDEDKDLKIKLGAMKQIFLGFDDLFPKSSVRSLGFFWQPLRIEYYVTADETETIYLIIDFNGVYTSNKTWFDLLIQMLG